MGAPYIYDISRLRVKKERKYCVMKGEVVDRTVWRSGFGRGCGSVVRQTAGLTASYSDTAVVRIQT